MAFYLRKSTNLGPFRLNLSKSGLGVSFGVKGARLSTGPRGTYVHMGRGGLYYRQKVAAPYGRPNTNGSPPGFSGAFVPPEAAYAIHTADISQLVESSSQQMIIEINERRAQRSFFLFVIITTLVVALLAAHLHWIVSLAILAVGIPLTIWTHMGDQVKRTTPLFYELEPDAQTRFDAVQVTLAALSQTQRLWRIRTQQATNNYKYNAGASSLITRTSATLRQGKPPLIATNVTVWNLHLDDQDLFFMPDQILVLQGKQYGVISYDTFRIEDQERIYIETESVPGDARVIDYTWKYVNKAGGPDRRFKNNVRIPRVIYGILILTSATGLNIHLYVSNRQIGSTVAQLFMAADRHGHTAGRAKKRLTRDEFASQPIRSQWHDVLGVAGTASREEITQAYHQMAKMYHPDKVAGLAPEFKALAEERMKEINMAYEELKRQRAA